MYYMNCFFIYSILGYILESIMYLIFKWHGESGILYGPWTPVYGFGVVIIILVTRGIFQHRNWNRLLKIVLTFFTVTILLSLIEWIGGSLIESIFHITFWDYSNHRFNIGKYISLEMSLLWGILSMVFIYLLKPISDNITKKIPNWVTYCLIILIIIDLILTLILKMK